MAQKIIGLDLGSYEVKAVLVEGGFRHLTVRRYLSATVAQDADRPLLERIGEALERLRAMDGMPLKPDAVYVAVPGGAVTSHQISLPFTDNRRIGQTLPFELEDLMPFDLSEVVFDHHLLWQADGKSELLVGVVKRSTLTEVIDTLAEAGFDPKAISLASLAYQNLFVHGVVTPLSHPPPFEGEPPRPATEAVLDIGHQATDLLILENGKARAARTFPIAGLALTRAIAAAERIELDEAERRKIEQGRLDARNSPEDVVELSKVIQRGLAPLIRGLRQSFFAYSARSRHKVERVLLTGGTARLTGIEHHLSRELGCEVMALDPFPEEGMQIQVDRDQADDPAASLAMSLALQTGTNQINFRRDEFHFEGDLSYLKGNLIRLAALAGVILALIGMNVYASIHALSVQEGQLDDALCEVTKRVLGECYTNPDDAISRLRGTTFAEGAVPRVSAAEVLVELTRRLKGMDDVQLSELDITGTKVRLHGEAGSFDSVAKVVDALKNYDCFAEVTQGKTRQAKKKSDRIEFNVDAKMAEECSS